LRSNRRGLGSLGQIGAATAAIPLGQILEAYGDSGKAADNKALKVPIEA
jgi:hypothetical protein